MIRHVVLVRFAPHVSHDEKTGIFSALDQLRSVVDGMVAFAAGPNVSPEGLARGYTHGFTADFADEASRDAYLVHPAHQAAGARLVAALEGGIDGLAVLDFAV